MPVSGAARHLGAVDVEAHGQRRPTSRPGATTRSAAAPTARAAPMSPVVKTCAARPRPLSVLGVERVDELARLLLEHHRAPGRCRAPSAAPTPRASCRSSGRARSASATVTQSLTPSNDSAPPKRPVVRARGAGRSCRCCRGRTRPCAVVPLASSKPHAPTSPVGGGGAVTVSVTGIVAGEPVAPAAVDRHARRCRCRGARPVDVDRHATGWRAPCRSPGDAASHAASSEAVNESVPPPVLATDRLCAAGLAPPVARRRRGSPASRDSAGGAAALSVERHRDRASASRSRRPTPRARSRCSVPAARPAVLTATLRSRGAVPLPGVTVSHGASSVAVNESVPPPVLSTPRVFAAGLAPPAVPLNDSDGGRDGERRRRRRAGRRRRDVAGDRAVGPDARRSPRSRAARRACSLALVCSAPPVPPARSCQRSVPVPSAGLSRLIQYAVPARRCSDAVDRHLVPRAGLRRVEPAAGRAAWSAGRRCRRRGRARGARPSTWPAPDAAGSCGARGRWRSRSCGRPRPCRGRRRCVFVPTTSVPASLTAPSALKVAV